MVEHNTVNKREKGYIYIYVQIEMTRIFHQLIVEHQSVQVPSNDDH